MEFHHHAVGVSDLARAEAFYAGLLGLEVIRRWEDDQGAPRSIWVRLEPGFVALERMDGPPKEDDGQGHHCFALRIKASERESWKERLEQAGVPIEKESHHSIYFRDPDGAQIALSHL